MDAVAIDEAGPIELVSERFRAIIWEAVESEKLGLESFTGKQKTSSYVKQ